MRTLLAVLAMLAPAAHTSRPLVAGEIPAAAVHATARSIVEHPGPAEHRIVTHHRRPRVVSHAATAPVVRGRCPQFEPLLVAYAPPGGWDVARMSALMYRESRCQPTVHTSCCWGLLEIHQGHDAALTAELGTLVDPETLQDPTTNVRAAAALCHARRVRHSSCYADWNGGPE